MTYTNGKRRERREKEEEEKAKREALLIIRLNKETNGFWGEQDIHGGAHPKTTLKHKKLNDKLSA